MHPSGFVGARGPLDLLSILREIQSFYCGARALDAATLTPNSAFACTLLSASAIDSIRARLPCALVLTQLAVVSRRTVDLRD
jgi:hypothetical protein